MAAAPGAIWRRTACLPAGPCHPTSATAGDRPADVEWLRREIDSGQAPLAALRLVVKPRKRQPIDRRRLGQTHGSGRGYHPRRQVCWVFDQEVARLAVQSRTQQPATYL